MTDSQQKENIINKLLALKRMTLENGCTESECTNAAAAITNILIKYQIDIAEVQEQKAEGIDKIQGKDQFNKITIWKMKLMQVLSEHHFCDFLINNVYSREKGKYVKSYLIIGRPTNVYVVQEMFEYLSEIIHKLSYKDWNEKGLRRGAVESSNIYFESWRQGCVKRIKERLEEKRKEMQVENANDCTALQIVNAYDKEKALIQEFIQSQFSNLGTIKNKSRIDNYGFHAGYKKGDSVGIDTQIGGRKSNTSNTKHLS